MRSCIFLFAFLFLLSQSCFCWGFFGHRKINQLAIYLLPPEMMVLFKPSSGFLEEHSVDPDKRRYAVSFEAPRHYIDIDHYGVYPFDSLPRRWSEAVERYSADTLNKYGVVPWWIQHMLQRLTTAFSEKNKAAILKYAAEIGHYIADAHVPLHATRNHNGQYTGQHGIHGFWESRVPELLAEKEWDFFIGKAAYIKDPGNFIWARVLESARAVDSVLLFERKISLRFPGDRKYSYEERNGIITRQYAADFVKAYDRSLQGMIERRMRQSIFAVASFWYTAWVNAGQPNLSGLSGSEISAEDLIEFEKLNQAWRSGKIADREHE